MPFYYDVSIPITTNSGAGTLSTQAHITLRTVSNQAVCMVKGCYADARSGTAGGGQIRGLTLGTPSSSGTTTVPNKRHPSAPAALTSCLTTGGTPGSSPNQRFSFGVAQTGGTGGWVAIEPDAAVQLLPNTGANGNLDIMSQFNAASVTVDLTLEFSE